GRFVDGERGSVSRRQDSQDVGDLIVVPGRAAPADHDSASHVHGAQPDLHTVPRRSPPGRQPITGHGGHGSPSSSARASQPSVTCSPPRRSSGSSMSLSVKYTATSVSILH